MQLALHFQIENEKINKKKQSGSLFVIWHEPILTCDTFQNEKTKQRKSQACDIVITIISFNENSLMPIDFMFTFWFVFFFLFKIALYFAHMHESKKELELQFSRRQTMEARSKLYTCEVISSIINLCLAVQLISHSYGHFASVGTHIQLFRDDIVFLHHSITEIISIHKSNIPHGIRENIKFSRIK